MKPIASLMNMISNPFSINDDMTKRILPCVYLHYHIYISDTLCKKNIYISSYKIKSHSTFLCCYNPLPKMIYLFFLHRKSISMQSTPYPRLLITYHKTINEKQEYSTKLVTPVVKLTATLSKINYLGIKGILDKTKVNYSRVTIFQASDQKEMREELGIK